MTGIFTRSKKNPVLKPNLENDWESFKVYNPGAFFEDDTYHLFYRAMNRGDNWRSSLGYATSSDGETFTQFPKPLLSPETQDEKRGLEDPRITKVGETYFMAYAAFDGDDVRLNIATSNNLKDWTKHGKAFSEFQFLKNGGKKFGCVDGKITLNNERAIGKERSKSGGIFPEKIDGKYWMIFGEHTMWLAHSEDGLQWSVEPGTFLEPRTGQYFDNAFVEMGPPPIKTEKGWLVLYHGIDEWQTYRLGILLLDLNDPQKIIYRSDDFIFEPEADYEMKGLVDVLPGGMTKIQKMNDVEVEDFLEESVQNKRMPAVVFCCGAVIVESELRIYYGAGDSYICTATAPLKVILDIIP
jgi:predicted GH43/DUF377 family glycosyl hydrolase